MRPFCPTVLLPLVLACLWSAAPAAAQTAVPTPRPAPPTGTGNLPDLGGTPQTSDQTAAQGTPDQGNPSIQYVVRPGGGIPDPEGQTFRPLCDAAVVGLRATIQY